LVTAEDATIYNMVAASTFIFWDQCITFREEVELIWRSKFSPVSLLFLVIRYGTLGFRIFVLVFYTKFSGLLRPSLTACKGWLWLEVALGLSLFCCVEIVLIMRVFAFYGRNKLLLASLLTLFACEHAAVLTIAAIAVPKFQMVPSPLPTNLPVPACLILYIPALWYSFWIPCIAFESTLFLLVISRFVRTKRLEIGNPRLLTIFVRDGVWAFTLIFAAFLWSILSAAFFDPTKGDIALTWFWSIQCFCGTRLVLNLRSAVQRRTLATLDTDLKLNFMQLEVPDALEARIAVTAGASAVEMDP